MSYLAGLAAVTQSYGGPSDERGKGLADKYFSRTFSIHNSVSNDRFEDLMAKKMVVWTEMCPKDEVAAAPAPVGGASMASLPPSGEQPALDDY